MSSALVAELDIDKGTRDEADWRPDLVPAPMINRFASENVETVANYVRETASAGIESDRAELLSADKWRRGRRPIALLPLTERVLYRSVTEILRAELPAVSRDQETYQEFLNRPLSVDGTTQILSTDLANFYSSIPLVDLGRELLHRTGRWEPVEWLQRFWESVGGRRLGIPQVNPSSDLIAETYADELHRRLLRRGAVSFRFSDDYRVATRSRSAAVLALEMFDEEARELGLLVNERKTRIESVDEYRARIDRQSENENEVFREARRELTVIEHHLYGAVVVPPEDAEVYREAARKMLNLWGSSGIDSGFDTDADAARFASAALAVLEALGDPSAVDLCIDIVRQDPQLMPAVCRYLASLLKTADSGRVVLQCKEIVHETVLSKWQCSWILAVIEGGGMSSDSDLMEWVSEQARTSQSEMVRSQAVWALACNYSLGSDVWLTASQASTRLGRPYLSAALANVDGSISTGDRKRHLDAGFLERRIFDWVQSRGLIPAQS